MHQAGAGGETDHELPDGVLLSALTQRDLLFTPAPHHPSHISCGGILANSVKSLPLPSTTKATSYQPITNQSSPTQDGSLPFPASPGLHTELFWVHISQSLFKTRDKQMTVAAWGHRSFQRLQLTTAAR